MDKVKKIDIHAHATAFPESIPVSARTGKRLLSGGELLEMYDKLGIEAGVLQALVSPEAGLTPITSESCKQIVDAYPGRFAWFCGVDPRALANFPGSDLTYLIQHYKSLGAKGLGEVNANMYMDDPMIDNLFFHCAQCDMPVMIHLGRKVGGGYGLVDEPGLPKLERMLQKYPTLRIFGHSVPFWNELFCTDSRGEQQEGRIAQLMRKYENLYCDLSAGSGSSAMMRDPEYTAAFMAEFQDRILYGCDIVSNEDAHPFVFRDFLDSMLENGKISLDVYNKICRYNAEKILGWKGQEL